MGIHQGINMANWILITLVILVILAVFFITVMLIDGNRFHLVKYQLYSSKIKHNHKYVILSDLHNKSYGKNNEKLIKSIDRQSPEAILIAGDMLISKPGKDFTVATDFIKNLALKYPIYYGMGNHETRLFLYPEVYGDMGKQYEEEVNKAQVTLMRNESREVMDNIRITGLDMKRAYYKRFKKTPMDKQYLEDTLGAANPKRYEILLAHNPDYFEEYAIWGADLVFSGHVHGGMMRLPVLGGVVSPAFKFFPKYDGGMFTQGKSTMILSRGLGMHSIPIRIFNPGELVVVELKPEKE